MYSLLEDRRHGRQSSRVASEGELLHLVRSDFAAAVKPLGLVGAIAVDEEKGDETEHRHTQGTECNEQAVSAPVASVFLAAAITRAPGENRSRQSVVEDLEGRAIR